MSVESFRLWPHLIYSKLVFSDFLLLGLYEASFFVFMRTKPLSLQSCSTDGCDIYMCCMSVVTVPGTSKVTFWLAWVSVVGATALESTLGRGQGRVVTSSDVEGRWQSLWWTGYGKTQPLEANTRKGVLCNDLSL